MAKHALFMGNCYLIYLLKFPLAQHIALNLANDAAAFACCFPSYMIVAWPKISTFIGGSTKERGLPVSEAEALLEKASVEEILDSLNQSEKDHSRQEEEIFKEWNHWYNQNSLSRTLENGSFGVLAGSVAWMFYLKRFVRK